MLAVNSQRCDSIRQGAVEDMARAVTNQMHVKMGTGTKPPKLRGSLKMGSVLRSPQGGRTQEIPFALKNILRSYRAKLQGEAASCAMDNARCLRPGLAV